MQDKPYQIGVIISSLSLIERIKKMAEDEGHNIHISRATFTEAVPPGKEMEANGVEVIISRRGVAQELRANLQIPVLSISRLCPEKQSPMSPPRPSGNWQIDQASRTH